MMHVIRKGSIKYHPPPLIIALISGFCLRWLRSRLWMRDTERPEPEPRVREMWTLRCWCRSRDHDHWHRTQVTHNPTWRGRWQAGGKQQVVWFFFLAFSPQTGAQEMLIFDHLFIVQYRLVWRCLNLHQSDSSQLDSQLLVIIFSEPKILCLVQRKIL